MGPRGRRKQVNTGRVVERVIRRLSNPMPAVQVMKMQTARKLMQSYKALGVKRRGVLQLKKWKTEFKAETNSALVSRLER